MGGEQLSHLKEGHRGINGIVKGYLRRGISKNTGSLLSSSLSKRRHNNRIKRETNNHTKRDAQSDK